MSILPINVLKLIIVAFPLLGLVWPPFFLPFQTKFLWDKIARFPPLPVHFQEFYSCQLTTMIEESKTFITKQTLLSLYKRKLCATTHYTTLKHANAPGAIEHTWWPHLTSPNHQGFGPSPMLQCQHTLPYHALSINHAQL